MRGPPHTAPEVGTRISAVDLDARLHEERLDGDGAKLTFRAELDELPDGTFVVSNDSGDARLLWHGKLHPWRHDGYLNAVPIESGPVEVLTPRSTVAALANGYLPQVRL